MNTRSAIGLAGAVNMRWIWIDKFVVFVSRERASAIKNVTLAEEYLHDHFEGCPVMPPSLIIEGMAQTAGILVGEARGFAENVVLAKIRRARLDEYVVAGDQLRFDAAIESIDERAAVTHGIVFKNDSPMGTVDLMFSHVNRTDGDSEVPSHNFVFSAQLRSLLGGFDRSGTDVVGSGDR